MQRLYHLRERGLYPAHRLTADELIGRHQHSIIHYTQPEGKPNAADTCPILAVGRKGRIYRCEEDLFWHKNGSSFPVAYTAAPLWKEGILVGSVVVFRDISERKRKETREQEHKQELEHLVRERNSALTQTHAQLFAILQAAAVAIIAVDQNGTITLFNAGAEALLGYTSQELVGQQTPLLFHLAAEVEARARLLSAFYRRQIQGMEVFTARTANGKSDTHEWTYVHKDGHHLTASLSTSAVHNADGVITGYLGVAHDVSSRKISEQKVEYARKSAARANKAKSEFLATMSHEIRTPMNGILGMAQLLRSSGLNARQTKRAEILCESAEALLVVLNDILDFSKMEAQKLELEVTDFALRKLVEGVADLLAIKAQEKGLDLTCLIEQSVPTLVRGDPTRLRQVLSNLLGNAVKFTALGCVGLRVSLQAESPNLSVRFEVTDTGIGIPAEKQHLLFERFAQADSSTSRNFGGTGLGLSIVRGIVEMMGGQVGVDSLEGQGSTFWFTAPLQTQPAHRRPRPLSLPGARVLVVDDNDASRRTTLELLQFWNCEAEQEANAAAALARLQSQPSRSFDVVVIDLEMPGMRGDILGQEIRKLPAMNECALILLVPLRYRVDVDSQLDSIFAAQVTKPVKQGELGTAIASSLNFDPIALKSQVVQNPLTEVTLQLRAKCRILAVDDNQVNRVVVGGMLEQLGYPYDLVDSGTEALIRLSTSNYSLVLTDCEMPGMSGYDLSALIRGTSSNISASVPRGAANGLRASDELALQAWAQSVELLAASKILNRRVPILAMTAHVGEDNRLKCLAAGMNDHVAKPLQTEDSFSKVQLLQRVMGNQELALCVVSGFLEDMPRQLQALTAAIAALDSNATAAIAHSIRGAAGTAGASTVQSAAFRLESCASQGDAQSNASILAEISHGFSIAASRMREFQEHATSIETPL